MYKYIISNINPVIRKEGAIDILLSFTYNKYSGSFHNAMQLLGIFAHVALYHRAIPAFFVSVTSIKCFTTILIMS